MAGITIKLTLLYQHSISTQVLSTAQQHQFEYSLNELQQQYIREQSTLFTVLQQEHERQHREQQHQEEGERRQAGEEEEHGRGVHLHTFFVNLIHD